MSAFARVTLVITSVHNVTLVTAFNLPRDFYPNLTLNPDERNVSEVTHSSSPFCTWPFASEGMLAESVFRDNKILHFAYCPDTFTAKLFSPIPPIYWQFALNKILKPPPRKNHEKPRKTKEFRCSLMKVKLPKIQILKRHINFNTSLYVRNFSRLYSDFNYRFFPL